MKSYAVIAGGLLAMCALSACDPRMDMHGEDPREFYGQHPIKNTIDNRVKLIKLHFAKGEERLSPPEIDRLGDNLHNISLLSVESIGVNFSTSDKKNTERKSHLTRMLRNMGYTKGEYIYDSSADLKSGEVELKLVYAVVVSPDCPDWRTSPTSTHSNTTQANFGCAHEFNLGRMVADPHDLVHGTDREIPIDTATAAKAVQSYHEGKISGGGTGGSSLTGGNSAEGSDAGSATGSSP